MFLEFFFILAKTLKVVGTGMVGTMHEYLGRYIFETLTHDSLMLYQMVGTIPPLATFPSQKEKDSENNSFFLHTQS